ncbi:Ecdysteroid kinase-domain-containing protein [Gaertneriomyces semiglobifer]|nr:Ecdysteroid kinase-domain-containing protein [Gaertneriomyces semiglobifer]
MRDINLDINLPPGSSISSIENVTSLWAGYGAIYRLHIASGNPQDPKTYILKHVDIPTGDSEHDDVGNKRKCISYQVEETFHTKDEFALQLIEADPAVAIPKPIPFSKRTQANDGVRILMTDLSPQYPVANHSLDHPQTLAVLKWLAGFHAHFWGTEPAEDPKVTVSKSGVWKQGGYWHLDTRREEFNAIPKTERWADFRNAAEKVSGLLKGEEDGQFRTLVHGDVKDANIMFSALVRNSKMGPPKCALYDFQYVGYGYGAVDIAYFVATSVDQRLVESQEEQLLSYYHEHLTAKLAECRSIRTAKEYSFEILRKHYGWAMIDWVRFMAGWGMWGNARYAERRARQALDGIR